MTDLTEPVEILVIGTGGTIGALGQDRLDYLNYPMSGLRLSATELLNTILLPEEIGHHIRVSDFPPVSSTEIGAKVWWRLREEILAAFNQTPGLQGIVITHGTSTLEETAFALDLFSDVPVPIILTGAQRPSNTLSSDAANNLWAAIQVAGDPKARDRGVMVVLDGAIHAAPDVTKAANFTLNAFQSLPFGPLGTIQGTKVRFHRMRETPRLHFPLDESAHLPRVDIVVSHSDADRALIDAAVSAGAQGLVMAGLAPGYATPSQRRALQDAQAAGVHVVMSSRAAIGPTSALDQNNLPGSIGSGYLSPVKARLLLSALLLQNATHNQMVDTFEAFS